MNNDSTTAIRDIITDHADKLAIMEARARHAESEVARLEGEAKDATVAINELVDALRNIMNGFSHIGPGEKSKAFIYVDRATLTAAYSTLAKYEPAE